MAVNFSACRPTVFLSFVASKNIECCWWILVKTKHSIQRTKKIYPASDEEAGLKISGGFSNKNTSNDNIKTRSATFWAQQLVGFDVEQFLLQKYFACWTLLVLLLPLQWLLHTLLRLMLKSASQTSDRSCTCFGAPYKPKRAVCCFLKCSFNSYPLRLYYVANCMLSHTKPLINRGSVCLISNQGSPNGRGLFYWSALFLVADSEKSVPAWYSCVTSCLFQHHCHY